jgi:hypothetical protein
LGILDGRWRRKRKKKSEVGVRVGEKCLGGLERMAGEMLPQQIALIASASEEATRFPEKREGHGQLLSGWRGGAKMISQRAC